MNFYYKTETPPKISDTVATCRFGQCKVIDIDTNNGYTLCRNIFTSEESWEITSDCDLIDRA